MNTKELIKIIDQYVSLLSNTGYFDSSKTSSMLKEAESLKKEYSGVIVAEDMVHVYEALCKKGETVNNDIKINKQDKKGNLRKAKIFLRYMYAAQADFKGVSTQAIGRYFLLYMTTAILFLALSPQYFGFVLPAIMFVPIYLGVKGVKNRAFSGFMMSMSVVPMGLMTATYWLQYGLAALGNLSEAIATVSRNTGIAAGTAQFLIYVPSALALVLAIGAAGQLYLGLKIRNYFV